MQHNDTGSYNIAIGDYALSASNTGSNNIAIGREAMYFQTNINTGNTAVGAQAMAGTSKASNYYNTAIGQQALHSAGNTSHNAGHNTAVGAEALYNNITGNYNTSIGSGACQYVTGSNKTCIGANSGPTSGSDWASDDKDETPMLVGCFDVLIDCRSKKRRSGLRSSARFRTIVMQSTVFLARRETDLVMIRSIFPALLSASIWFSSTRCFVEVPEIPLSAQISPQGQMSEAVIMNAERRFPL